MEKVLVDTCIFIDLFKGNNRFKYLLSNFDFSINSIVFMELLQGAKNKNELNAIDKFLSNFTIAHLNNEISKKALNLVKTYSKSHNLQIPDALIASTVICNKMRLLTLNKKDFSFIENLEFYNQLKK